MTFYKKRTALAVRFLSYILIDKFSAPWYNCKDKYSGLPHIRLAAFWQDIFLGLQTREETIMTAITKANVISASKKSAEPLTKWHSNQYRKETYGANRTMVSFLCMNPSRMDGVNRYS